MLRRRIRSALYIDFENVPLPPESIGSWLAWLEDGVFDPSGARRHFLQKRVYWNSHAERNRDVFQKHGFAPILIGKYSGLKNGADIRMAMDIVETTYMRSDIDEFILLTGDSDFVPVIERLKEKAKRSAIVATEHRPNIHTTYHGKADLLIPSRRLTEAAQYKRRPPGLLARLLRRTPAPAPSPGRQVHSEADATTVPPGGRARPSAVVVPFDKPASDPPPLIEIAARRVAKILTQQPRNYVSQKRVLSELDRVQSFKRQGPTAFFGTGSYKALMRELARVEPRITAVDQPGGGTGVVYIPPQATPEPPETQLEHVNGATGEVAEILPAPEITPGIETDAVPDQTAPEAMPVTERADDNVPDEGARDTEEQTDGASRPHAAHEAPLEVRQVRAAPQDA